MATVPLHAPARQPGETQAAYRLRRAASALIARTARAEARNDRTSPSSRAQLRDLQRRNGSLEAGAFGRGLATARARKQLDALQRKHRHTPRDEHGAVTQTGAVTNFVDVPRDPRWVEHGASSDGCWHGRRKWLAGVSAQRGY